MTIHRSKSKAEVEFKYDGRPFSEPGSSFILAVDWGISLKFGRQREIHLLKPEPGSRFPIESRYPEKSIWRHSSAANRWIATKFGRWMQSDIQITTHKSQSNPEVQFQYGGLAFYETGSSFISAVHWYI